MDGATLLTRDRFVDLRTAGDGLDGVQRPGRRIARSPRGRSFLTFLMVMGPGLIVMEADNDAGAVQTYTQQVRSMDCTCFGCFCCCYQSATSFKKWWRG